MFPPFFGFWVILKNLIDLRKMVETGMEWIRTGHSLFLPYAASQIGQFRYIKILTWLRGLGE